MIAVQVNYMCECPGPVLVHHLLISQCGQEKQIAAEEQKAKERAKEMERKEKVGREGRGVGGCNIA